MLESALQIKKSTSRHPLEKYMKWDLAPNVKTYHNSINNPEYPKKKLKRTSLSRVTFTVIGNRVTKEFLECCEWVTVLHTYRSDNFGAPIIRGLTQLEWKLASNDLKLRYGGNAFCSKKKVAVLVGKEFLGDDEDLKRLLEKKYYYRISMNYRKRGIEEFIKYMKNSERKFAYMHIMIGDEYSGSLIFMLYSDLVPLTCDNFLRLCAKRRGGYAGTSIHRIVKDGWVQCGGYGLKRVVLPCENYAIPHDKRGVLSMANDGRYCDNSTQFFITLNTAHWMDQKYVAFGQLVDGDETLKKLENVPTRYEAPTSKITICKAEILEEKPPKLSPCPNVVDYLDKHVVNVTQLAIGIIDEVIEAVDFGIVGEASVEFNEEQKQDGDKSERNGEDDDPYEDALDLLLPSIQASSAARTTEPHRILYLPLSDVPYPGECASDCDLECIKSKCMSADKGVAKPTLLAPTSSKISMHASTASPELNRDSDVCTRLHEYIRLESRVNIILITCSHRKTHFTSAMLTDDITSNDDLEIQEYLRLNADRLSFTGSVIRTMARNLAQTNLLANLSIRNSALIMESEQTKIRKRQAAGVMIVAPPDRREREPSLGSVDRDADDEMHGGPIGLSQLASTIDLQDVKKSVRIASWIMSRTQNRSYPDRRLAGYIRPSASTAAADRDDGDADGGDADGGDAAAASSQGGHRRSALSTLLERDYGSADIAPRLKDFRRMSSMAPKNFFLTSSAMNRRPDLNASPREKLLRGLNLAQKTSTVSPDNLLTLRHGPRLMRRYSSDYVHSRFMIEKANQRELSMRAVEFAKRWPSLSVTEYKRRSMVKEKEEPDKTIQKSIEKTIDLHRKMGQSALFAGGVGVRMPGDSPAYSWMEGLDQDMIACSNV